MAPIYEQEWMRLQFSVECDPVFGVGNSDDSTHATRAAEVNNKEDSSQLYVWCKEAHTIILTVHPDMGLAHRQMKVDVMELHILSPFR
jgi:hypothetical protein